MVSLCACFQREGLGPGEQAPDFSLNDLNGKIVSLSDFRGNVVVLNFWASWCSPCIEEMPQLDRLYKKHGKARLVVLAIAEDESAEEVRSVTESLRLSFPILIDKTGDVKNKYKVQGYPETYILDADGKVVLFPDPAKDNPTTKVIGPRRWDAPEYEELLVALAQ